jgi:hypothetical protein
MIEVLAIDTPSLGDRSYLATDGVCARGGRGPGARRAVRAHVRRSGLTWGDAG